ncbi:metal-dependent hydrolase [Listeria monocytogenes]|nr:metal-dependent hydrolase [Listeria monocytogenes]
MRYKTHLITTFVLATPSAYMTNNLDLLGVCGLAIGALLPDIDEPNSFIGRRITIIPNIVKIIFGHRGMTHTLLATMLFVYLAIEFPNEFTKMLALGYFLHIVEDTFSVNGVQWFAPITAKKIAFKWYITGKTSETIIMGIMLIYLCLEYYIILL